jgi:hypothetical protein
MSSKRRKKSLNMNEAFHLSRESAEDGVPEVTQRTGEVLVEEVSQELAHSQVRPSAVNK